MMELLLQQIEEALTDRLYFVALFTALGLPDICGAIDSSDGQATGPRYQGWFDEYVASKCYGVLSGQDCYIIRCSVLHQGTLEHSRSRYSRIILTPPNPQQIVVHLNRMSDASGTSLDINIETLCRDLVASVRTWLAAKSNDALFQTNITRFMNVYPHGFGHIQGIPVIA
jgi:hypothetical protein